MNGIIKNTVGTILVSLYLCFIFIQIFFPVIDKEINNYLFFNDSLFVSIIIFIVFCWISYLSFKEILLPEGYQYKHRIYRSIRAVFLLFAALFAGYNVYMKIQVF